MATVAYEYTPRVTSSPWGQCTRIMQYMCMMLHITQLTMALHPPGSIYISKSIEHC